MNMKEPRLFTVPPDFDLVLTIEFRQSNFTADRSGHLFSASVPGSFGTIHIVQPDDSRLNPKVLLKVAAHSLSKEFFPSIAIFGHGRIGIRFDKTRVFRTVLFTRGVDAGG